MENLTHTDRGAVSSYSFQWIGNYEAEIPVFHTVKKVKLNEVEIPFYIFSLIISFLFYFTFIYTYLVSFASSYQESLNSKLLYNKDKC